MKRSYEIRRSKDFTPSTAKNTKREYWGPTGRLALDPQPLVE